MAVAFYHSLVQILTLAVVTVLPILAVHKFPDGYVERTVSVVVRDRIAIIEISAGMNDPTIRTVIDDWSEDRAPATQPDESRQLNDSKTKKSLLEKSLPEKSPADLLADSNIDVSDSQSPANDGESDTGSAATIIPSGNSQAKNSQASSQSNPNDLVDDEFKNDQSLIAELNAAAIERLKNGLTVTCDGKLVELQIAESQIPIRQHMSLTIRYQFELPDQKKVNLAIEDRNFSSQVGGVRYALKTRGSALISSSNVAPIIVRADRKELEEMTPDERAKTCSIVAGIILVGK